jgi:hypothetical protein
MGGCPSPDGRRPAAQQPSASSPLIGMTGDAVLSCAGSPQDRLNMDHDVAVFRYYKEAAMLDESQVGSKGSVPGVHRGCWTNLLIEKGKVTGVEFRPIPDQERDPFLCHEIFEACSQ